VVEEKHDLHVLRRDSGRGEKGSKKECLDWWMAYAMRDGNTWGWDNSYSERDADCVDRVIV
jgi:hypothetical protein